MKRELGWRKCVDVHGMLNKMWWLWDEEHSRTGKEIDSNEGYNTKVCEWKDGWQEWMVEARKKRDVAMRGRVY